MTTGFIYDERFLLHDTGPAHPESNQRLAVTTEHLTGLDWFSSLHQLPRKLADIEQLLSIHDHNYVKRAAEVCRAGNAYLDSMDVSVCRESFDIARLAAGSVMEMGNQLMDETIRNGFALLRPPGHHAENGMALGFCLLNNIALLARHLQTQHGLDKIAIVDWDVHHGNGTQHLFEEDPSILYISLHQFPHYPGTGNYDETGIGKGTGATLNCPMPAGADDKMYEAAFTDQILPRLNTFKPECILISAGFDAHQSDPLANINLSTDFFGWMTDRLMEKAEQYCNNRMLSVLEGGYNLETLPACIEKHLISLMRLTPS